jgi:uncharacterized protein (DUF58 family)
LRFTNEGLLWLVLACVVGFLGWWKSINAVFLLSYFMLALLLLNAFSARIHVRRVKVVRDSLPPIHAREEVTIRVTVSNIASRPATVVVEETAAGESATGLVADLPGGASTPCRLRRTFTTRGLQPARLRVSSGYPLGLIAMTRSVTAGDILVLPAIGTIEPNGLRRWLLRHAGDGDRSRKALRSLTSDQADVRGVRPYRPGDAINTIHWRSTARRGEPMVREYDTARSVDLVLVVEPWLPAVPTPRQRADLEAALSLAATIAANWTEVYGTRLTLAVAGDPDSIRTAAPSDSGVREALAPLARVAGSLSFEPLQAESFNRSLARMARLVVSSRANSPYAGVLAQTTGRPFVAVAPTDRLPWYQAPGV